MTLAMILSTRKNWLERSGMQTSCQCGRTDSHFKAQDSLPAIAWLSP